MSEDNKNLLTEGTVRRFMTLANLKSITPLREQPELPLEDEEAEEDALALDDAGEADLALDLGDDDAAADLELDALGAEEGAEEDDAASALADELADALKPVLQDFLAQNAEISVEDEAAMAVPALDDEVEVELDVEPAGEPDVELEDEVELAEGADKNTGMSGYKGDDDDDTYMGHMKEDSGEDEGRHYDDDAHNDDDHINAIRHHLDALEHDRDYDDDHIDEDVGSKKGEYKRRGKSAEHPEGHRAGDVDGHYKDYEGHRGGKKGEKSKTHPGEEDYTTKKDDDKKTSGKGRGEKKGDKAYVNEDKLVEIVAQRVAERMLKLNGDDRS